MHSSSASYHPRNILGEVASSTPLVLLDFYRMAGLSCGRPSDRASFVFPLRSHLTSWHNSSFNFFQLKLPFNICSSSSFPSPFSIDADPPTEIKTCWTTLKSSSGQTNPPSSSLAISHRRHTKHTVSQGQTTATTSSLNSMGKQDVDRKEHGFGCCISFLGSSVSTTSLSLL